MIMLLEIRKGIALVADNHVIGNKQGIALVADNHIIGNKEGGRLGSR